MSGEALSLSDLNVPVALPETQNVLSSASGTFIQAVAESGVSEYVYLDLFAGVDVPVGTYGGPGSNGFRYRLTYDFV